MAEISVIVPLYNAEKYLRECLDSIINQCYYNFELICIDDCSTDSTLSIVKSYSKLDCRVKILLNSRHMGAAYSRNRGIGAAHGEYLLFLDGDDYFDEKLLKLAYDKAKESMADIVVYQSIYTTSDKIHEKIFNYLDDEFKRKYCTHTFKMCDLKPYEYLMFLSAPWDKIYRKSFIMKEHLKFQDLSCCNDCYFVNMALLLANRIIFLNTKEVLAYIRMHNTKSRISFKRDPMCSYWAEIKILEELMIRGKMELLHQHYYTRAFFHFYMVIRNTEESAEAKNFYTFLQTKGIERMQMMGMNHYENLNPYVKRGIEKFISKSYESKWYENENKFQIALNYNVENLRRLFEDWKKKGKKIGLWGIESYAKVFLYFCKKHFLQIDQVMDRDERKQGVRILDFSEICYPQIASQKVQVIIFTKADILKEAEKIIGDGSQTELLNIVSYLDVY